MISNSLLLYFLQEVLVKGLAESRTFQRFALRTHTSIEEMKGKGTEHLNATLDELSKAAVEQTASSGGPPKPPLRGIPGFFSAFGKEIRKDLGFGN